MKTHPTTEQKREFYNSWEWNTLRVKTLMRHGRKCGCCGNSADNGAIIQVDHIKPLHEFWDLRLEPENLQVLCSSCNKGKGAWDQTDYRKPYGEGFNEPFVMLTRSLLDRPEWHSLSGNAAKAYVLLRSRYNGSNNGKIGLSSRDAGRLMGMSAPTAARAIVELAEAGFIIIETKSSFGVRRAAEYRIL